MTKKTKKKSEFEKNVDALFLYFERKYQCSKLYRGIVKTYGFFAMMAIMLAVSAIDYHPGGALLWIVRVPLLFIVLNMTVLALDLVGYAVYEMLKGIYEQEERQRRPKRPQPQQRRERHSKKVA